MLDDIESPVHKIQHLRDTEDELLLGSFAYLLCKHGGVETSLQFRVKWSSVFLKEQ